MAVECQSCTEAINQNYTLRTGRVTVCLESDGIVRDLGDVQGLEFSHAPEFIEHFRGSDGALDAVIPLRREFTMNMTLHELTPANMALVVGGSQVVNTPSGCKIPLTGFTGDCSPSVGAIEFLHTFACGAKTFAITLWRAVIAASETTLTFGDSFVELPISVRALPCDSLHPTEPYGVIEFSEECDLS